VLQALADAAEEAVGGFPVSGPPAFDPKLELDGINRTVRHRTDFFQGAEGGNADGITPPVDSGAERAASFRDPCLTRISRSIVGVETRKAKDFLRLEGDGLRRGDGTDRGRFARRGADFEENRVRFFGDDP
jgi:hypothetical protein